MWPYKLLEDYEAQRFGYDRLPDDEGGFQIEPEKKRSRTWVVLDGLAAIAQICSWIVTPALLYHNKGCSLATSIAACIAIVSLSLAWQPRNYILRKVVSRLGQLCSQRCILGRRSRLAKTVRSVGGYLFKAASAQVMRLVYTACFIFFFALGSHHDLSSINIAHMFDIAEETNLFGPLLSCLIGSFVSNWSARVACQMQGQPVGFFLPLLLANPVALIVAVEKDSLPWGICDWVSCAKYSAVFFLEVLVSYFNFF